MELRRTTPNLFDKSSSELIFSSDDFTCNAQVVTINFPRFGEGTRRQSDFKVRANWQDVERIVQEFCEARHPEALAIHEAMKLAAAAKELGWRPPEPVVPQSN
jgi:hypothetical protein